MRSNLGPNHIITKDIKVVSTKGYSIKELVVCILTMANKLMYILNNDTQNYPFCRLKLVVEIFEHLKSLKLLNQRIRKRYQNFWD